MFNLKRGVVTLGQRKGDKWWIATAGFAWLFFQIAWEYPHSTVWHHTRVTLSWLGEPRLEWLKTRQIAIPFKSYPRAKDDDRTGIGKQEDFAEAIARATGGKAPFWKWYKDKDVFHLPNDDVGEFVVTGEWIFNVGFLGREAQPRKYPAGTIPCAGCGGCWRGLYWRKEELKIRDAEFIENIWRVQQPVCRGCRMEFALNKRSDELPGLVAKWQEEVFRPFAQKETCSPPDTMKRLIKSLIEAREELNRLRESKS